MKIYFYYPSNPYQPTDELKSTRLTVQLLNELGVTSLLLPKGRIRDDYFFQFKPPKAPFEFDEAVENLREEDIMILPENFPELFLRIKNFRCKKVIYYLNGLYALAHHSLRGYRRLGIDFVMAPSSRTASLAYEFFGIPRERIFVIPPWVVRNPFVNLEIREETRPLAICYMQRKVSPFVNRIKNIVKKIEPRIPWVMLYGLPEKEVARCLHSYSIFFSQGTEGVGMDVLEAMVCGSLVTGNAAIQGFFPPFASSKNGLWAPDHSTERAVEQLLKAIRIVREQGVELNRFLTAGRRTAQIYTKERTLAALARMLKVIEKGGYPSEDFKIKPLDKKDRILTQQILKDREGLYKNCLALAKKIKKGLPGSIKYPLKKIRDGMVEFLFLIYKLLTPLKRLFFSLYCEEMEFSTRQKGFSILPLGIKSRFHELGGLLYNIEGTLLELNPFCALDRKLISGVRHDPIVSLLIKQCLGEGGGISGCGCPYRDFFSSCGTIAGHESVCL